ncbi:hypothetical protein QL285_053739 [Trifolium repens]|nr:hypothetical protein QL285_053739 [Trifolium repens]
MPIILKQILHVINKIKSKSDSSYKTYFFIKSVQNKFYQHALRIMRFFLSIMCNKQQPGLAPHAQFPVHHAQTTESTVPLVIVFRSSKLEILRYTQ